MYDRRTKIGASDAVHIANGEWQALYDAKQAATPPQMGLAAQIGKQLEKFHRTYFTEQTGLEIHFSDHWEDAPLTGFGPNPHIPLASSFSDLKWYTYVPDGLCLNDAPRKKDAFDISVVTPTIPWEGKAINLHWSMERLLKKYYPQLLHAMRVLRADHCYFSVLFLNIKWEHLKVPNDPAASDALFEMEKAFYWHLENEIRPTDVKVKK